MSTTTLIIIIIVLILAAAFTIGVDDGRVVRVYSNDCSASTESPLRPKLKEGPGV
jgi:hypothetical protein